MPFKKGEVPKGAKLFQKGKSGNPKGRPKIIPEINELLADVLSDEQNGIVAAKAILMSLRREAIKGDVRAAEVLLNRAYGKPEDKNSFFENNVVTIKLIRE
jgi:hypothetical protein